MPNDNLREEKESKEVIHAEAFESAEEEQRKYNESKAKIVKHILGDLEHQFKKPAEEWGLQEEYMLLDILGLLSNSVNAFLSGNIPDYQV